MPSAARPPHPGTSDVESATRPQPAVARPPGVPFGPGLELAELDDRHRPSSAWTGRAVELSRSHLVLRSRRMCYIGRNVVVLVHLVDDKPVALFGTVRECEYDADGLYRTRLELSPPPEVPPLVAWLRERDARGVLYSPTPG